MKKIVSFVLCAVLMLNLMPLFSFAKAPLTDSERWPESTHPYSNNMARTYRYRALDPAVQGLLVTFSKDTWTEPYQYNSDDKTYKYGDRIYLYDDNDLYMDGYYGDGLSGKTVYFEGSSFAIYLDTDESETGYGFSIDSIVALYEDDMISITYDSGVEGVAPYTYRSYKDGTVVFDYAYRDGYNIYTPEGYTLAGWSTEPDGQVMYLPEAQVDAKGLSDMTVYPVWCKLILDSSEIYSFSNSETYFGVDEEKGYYMTEDNYNMMIKNIMRNFAPNILLAGTLSAVLSTYPSWDFQGSCYGMSTTVALQHYGKLDLLSQQGASCVNDLEPTKELISLINYYQSQVATSMLTENKGITVGTPLSKQQLKKLYDTVSKGRLAQFTFYYNSEYSESKIPSGHTVLISGAYTDKAGNHVLVPYDNNTPSTYENGICSGRFVISSDWSRLTRDGMNEKILLFHWTDTLEQYEAFHIDGKGETVKWYQTFFNHIIDLIKTLFSVFFR